MAYIMGSVTDANPGPALYALMAPALTTAGFTLVDTVVISTRTHKVWKSAAASNAQNLDWYLDIAYTTTGAGTVSLIAFEFYDPATDLAYRGPYIGGVNTIDPATGTRYGAAGFALETNWFSAATTGSQTALGTTAFGYWISITADRAILLCSGAPSTVMVAGFYNPDPLYSAKAGSLLYPLVCGQAGPSSLSQNAAITRVAPWTAFPTGTWSTATIGSNQSFAAIPSVPQLPSGSVVGYPFVAVPLPIYSGAGLANLGRWGWYRDVFLVATTGVVRGDTCTINGAAHVLTSSSAGFSYAFKAA